MSHQRVDLQPAYILHTRPYRDTSLLIDALTLHYGRVSLMAKGARKAIGKGRTHQRSLLQPFISLQLSWQGKSSLKTLVGSEVVNNYNASLTGHHLYSALYMNELLMYLLPQENPTDDIYALYHVTLQSLNDRDFALETCLRQFEFQLLNQLGYGINVYTEANSGNDLEPHKEYNYVLQHGFIEAEGGRELEHSVRFKGEDIINIQQGFFDTESASRSAKIIMRLTLKPLLKNKVLKSRELFTLSQ